MNSNYNSYIVVNKQILLLTHSRDIAIAIASYIAILYA